MLLSLIGIWLMALLFASLLKPDQVGLGDVKQATPH